MATKLTRRCIRIARAQVRAGGWVSIENPEDSLIWHLKPMNSLGRVLEKVQEDQCSFGGLWRKPTCWLTNATWLRFLTKRCPGWPEHCYEPLVGKAFTAEGKEVWKTQLAAEYHESLCEAIAQIFRAVHQQPFVEVPSVVVQTGCRTKDPMQEATKK